MPRPRFQNLDSDRRREILEVSAKEFATHGYKGASLNNVIGQLGLSKGVFYYYFDDKADLFGAVLEMVWGELVPADITVLGLRKWDAANFWGRLADFVNDAREHMRRWPWLGGILRMFYVPPADPRVSRLMASKLEEARALQAAWVRHGQEIGVVRRDLAEDLLVSLLMAVDEASDRWLLANWDRLTPEERGKVTESTFRVIRTLLEPPPAAVSSMPAKRPRRMSKRVGRRPKALAAGGAGR